ncbi:MAG: GTP cyclohydrolase II [Paracoccaceae bacterium]|jgi:GTP cyclohydrolase II
MALLPSPAERRARARADLRMGVPVVLCDGDVASLVVPVETVSPDRFAALRAIGGIVLVITARRAQTLRARAYDGDLARIKVAPDRPLKWVQGVADPATDLSMPMKGPFVSLREGAADSHRAAIALVKESRLLPAVLMVTLDDPRIGDGLTCLDITDVPAPAVYRDVIAARLPMQVSEEGRLHVFRPDDGGEEHYAIEIGQPTRDAPVLARLHSACFTGDLMGSLKCDCGPQLRGALGLMGQEGAGVLVYLNQEGRGIGLANKMRAYALQDQGFDTVEANHRLGFEDDERDFRIGAAILQKLGFDAVRLMTNNPAKIAMMEKQGISVVERVPLKVGETKENRGYLATKAAKSGHLL